MAATLIHKLVTVSEQQSWADDLGYAYCFRCGDDIDKPLVAYTPANSADICDRCGMTLSDSLKSTTGIVTIEYFQCKIF
jgi:hypothetical protein